MSPLRGLSLSPSSDIKIMELRETEKKLLTAVSTIIEEEGFTKLGVNHIARQAKCDKVLIYRYFGGLEGYWLHGQNIMTFTLLLTENLPNE